MTDVILRVGGCYAQVFSRRWPPRRPQASRPSGLAPDALSNARSCSLLPYSGSARSSAGWVVTISRPAGRVKWSLGFLPLRSTRAGRIPRVSVTITWAGKDNYAVDREAAAEVLRAAPDVRAIAREHRAFLQRVVRFLVGEAGIRQITDIGTGVPAADNVHEVAQQIAPEVRAWTLPTPPAHACRLSQPRQCPGGTRGAHWPEARGTAGAVAGAVLGTLAAVFADYVPGIRDKARQRSDAKAAAEARRRTAVEPPVSDDGPESSFLLRPERAVVEFTGRHNDPVGNLWVGASTEGETEPIGCLRIVTPALEVRTVLEGLTIPNGIDWSSDRRWLNFADSRSLRVEAFPFENARLGPPTTLARVDPGQGIPDGLTVDSEGAVWVAYWDRWRVQRHLPDGPSTSSSSCPWPRSRAAPSAPVTCGISTSRQRPTGSPRRTEGPARGRPVFRVRVDTPGLPTRRFPLPTS
jgi:hypothetical protein